MRTGRWVSAMVVALLAACVCGDDLCAAWATRGDSYQVELVELLNDSTTVRSCGDDFDVAVGGMIELGPIERAELRKSGHYCQNDCFEVQADADVPGVVFLEAPDAGAIGAETELETSSGLLVRPARVGDCEGSYSLQFDKFTSAERARQRQSPTNFLLTRRFQADPGVGACTGLCEDQWSVEVTNSQGKTISRDVGR